MATTTLSCSEAELLTLAMVETNSMMTVAMWTTKIPASSTNILASQSVCVRVEEGVSNSDDSGGKNIGEENKGGC